MLHELRKVVKTASAGALNPAMYIAAGPLPGKPFLLAVRR